MLLKKIKNHLTLNNGVLGLALLITASWVWGTIDAIGQNFSLQQQVDTMKQQITIDQIKNQSLAYRQQYYSSNEFLELSAREHLNKASPGEKLLILPPTTIQSSTPTATEQIAPKPQPEENAQQWLDFLFGSKGS